MDKKMCHSWYFCIIIFLPEISLYQSTENLKSYNKLKFENWIFFFSRLLVILIMRLIFVVGQHLNFIYTKFV